jgi:CBS domain-containing protein
MSGWPKFWDAVTLARGANVSPGLLLVSWLGTINAAVFLFNLLPAFPLDGGRIVRAIAWRITGDRLRATRASATLGQIFSWILIGLGLAEILFTGATLSGVWLMVLGWFLGQAARGAVAQTAFSERLEGVTVADIMDSDPVTIPASVSASRALDEWFLRYRWPWFPVVEDSGRFAGIVEEERVQGAERGGEGERPVRELLEPGEGEWRVGADATLESLLGSEPLRRTGALFAVDGDGRLRGVVTIDQVRRALQSAAVPGTP